MQRYRPVLWPFRLVPKWAPASTTAKRSSWSSVPGGEEPEPIDSFYDSTVENLAREPVTRLTMRRMLDLWHGAARGSTGRIESARFVHAELPKRLARRLLDLQLLPHLVVTNPHIHTVYRAYFRGLRALREFPQVDTAAQSEAFTLLLQQLVDDMAPLLDMLATGLREVRSRPLVGERLQLDPFLENMLRSRISRRTLAEQHMYLNQARPGYVGIVCMDMHVADGIEFAAARCKQVCSETYGVAPDVLISGDRRLCTPYIPSHFDYMVYEVLKNSARAVVERHVTPGTMATLGRRLPPIRVRVCTGDDTVTLRISDEGGGIPQAIAPRIWEYGFTTLGQEPPVDKGRTEGLGFDPSFGAAWSVAQIPATTGNRFRMGGLGFGLPLSRLYARYFGGDLEVKSMPGYGTDAFLTLPRLDNEEWQETDVEDFTKPLPNLYQ